MLWSLLPTSRDDQAPPTEIDIPVHEMILWKGSIEEHPVSVLRLGEAINEYTRVVTLFHDSLQRHMVVCAM